MTTLFGIFGAGGCGRGIMPLARAQLAREGNDAARLVFIDDQVSAKDVNGHQVLSLEAFFQTPAAGRIVAVAMANSRTRENLVRICEARGAGFWTVQAGNAVVMDDVEIGEGALISPFVTITSNIRIGRHFHANIGSYVEHDCRLGDFVTFAPGVKCNGNVVIEDHAYIGAGAVIRQGRPGAPLTIGKGATVGMGAVVARDVPAGTTVVGNPARPLIKNLDRTV